MQGGALLGPGDGVMVLYWCSYLYLQSKKKTKLKNEIHANASYPLYLEMIAMYLFVCL